MQKWHLSSVFIAYSATEFIVNTTNATQYSDAA